MCCVGQTGQLSPARELDPAIALLQGSFSELRHFKVLGILDSVMLVMDVNTDNTFVIKVSQFPMLSHRMFAIKFGAMISSSFVMRYTVIVKSNMQFF